MRTKAAGWIGGAAGLRLVAELLPGRGRDGRDQG
jgi:hypothetical protein